MQEDIGSLVHVQKGEQLKKPNRIKKNDLAFLFGINV